MDEKVSRLVYLARLMERLVHEDGPWFVAVGDVAVPVIRRVENDEIVLEAKFPSELRIGSATISLMCRDEIVLIRPFYSDAVGPKIEWVFSPFSQAQVA